MNTKIIFLLVFLFAMPIGAQQEVPPIRNFLRVNDQFCTGGQPRLEHLQQLKDEGVKAIMQHQPELIFLDIQMPKITGLEFFKTLQHAPPVIFTTAFPQYALEGFELNALDYLVKPISFDRFLKATMRAKEFYEVRQKNIFEATSNTVVSEYFFIKADNKLVKIFFDDILMLSWFFMD